MHSYLLGDIRVAAQETLRSRQYSVVGAVVVVTDVIAAFGLGVADDERPDESGPGLLARRRAAADNAPLDDCLFACARYNLNLNANGCRGVVFSPGEFSVVDPAQ